MISKNAYMVMANTLDAKYSVGNYITKLASKQAITYIS